MTEKQKPRPEHPNQTAPFRHEIKPATQVAERAEPGFDLYLFNTARHLATQRASQPFSVELWDTGAQQMVGLFHADHAGEEAVSLPNAPFGGLEFAPGIPVEALSRVLAAIETYCRERKITRITVKPPPVGYDAERFLFLQKVYESQGFTIARSLVSHHIPVSAQAFDQIIHPSEQKRLRKCRRAGFVAEQWENPNPERVFTFLAESRERQGYALTVHLDQLRALLTRLPDQVRVFVVKDGSTIISLTVAIRVSRRILYNFCPADDLAYRTFSPTVLLNGALYEYARGEGIELIDLGVSLDHLGNEKPSLIRFKENLGGQASAKVTYQKIFA